MGRQFLGPSLVEKMEMQRLPENFQPQALAQTRRREVRCLNCKYFNVGNGCCYNSDLILNSDGPRNIPMECEFGGNPQKCLDNLIVLNGKGIVWPQYATVRIRQTNPNALEFKQKQEKESQ